MEHALNGFTVGITATHANDQLAWLQARGATCIHGPMLDQPTLLAGAAFSHAQRRWTQSAESSAAFGLVHAVGDHRVDALMFTSARAIANFLAVADASIGRVALHRAAETTTQLFVLNAKMACALSASGIGEAEAPAVPTRNALLELTAHRLDSSATSIDVCGSHVCLRGREIRVGDGEPAMLARRERRVLALLASRPGVVYSKASLLAEVWSGETNDPTVVDATIGGLRQRLGDAGDAIETVMRSGYRLQAA